MQPSIGEFLSSWTLEPVVVVGLALTAGLYAIGGRRLRRLRGGPALLPAWRVWSYTAGLLLVGLTLLSPVATFDDELLLLHMLQHLLLISAAPLLLLGRPLLPWLWALPPGPRRSLGLLFVPGRPPQRLFGFLTHPAVAVTVFLLVIGIWHLPALYDAAQGDTWVHEAEHTAFLGGALLYWWPLVHPFGGRRRLGYGAGILYLWPAIAEQNAIGLILAWTQHPVYSFYEDSSRLWGISPVLDQNLSGGLMSVVGTAVNAIAMTVLVARFFAQQERQASAEDEARAGRASPTEVRKEQSES
ncbi:MAG: cytochrome c oxidase assembly protein [Chloroflexi bacterium]|nr:cytochrome c oxidase assembly protein [Chloroflexota bacterium]